MNRKDYLHIGIVLIGLALIILVAFYSAGCAVVSTSKSDDMVAEAGGTNVKIQTVAPTNGYDFALALIKWMFIRIIGAIIVFWVIKGWIDGDLDPRKVKHG